MFEELTKLMPLETKSKTCCIDAYYYQPSTGEAIRYKIIKISYLGSGYIAATLLRGDSEMSIASARGMKARSNCPGNEFILLYINELFSRWWCDSKKGVEIIHQSRINELKEELDERINKAKEELAKLQQERKKYD